MTQPLALVALLVVALLLVYLFWPRRRSRAAQERLERATSRVDRELAGNLELVGMFFQTKQPAVLEIAGYRESRGEIAAADAALAARLDGLYDAIPDAESAMERRGPVGSLAPADREAVHEWEGRARELQREVRDLSRRPPSTPGARLLRAFLRRSG